VLIHKALGGKWESLPLKRVLKHMKKNGLTQQQIEADTQRAGVIKVQCVVYPQYHLY
jgi:hypothetical protein